MDEIVIGSGGATGSVGRHGKKYSRGSTDRSVRALRDRIGDQRVHAPSIPRTSCAGSRCCARRSAGLRNADTARSTLSCAAGAGSGTGRGWKLAMSSGCRVGELVIRMEAGDLQLAVEIELGTRHRRSRGSRCVEEVASTCGWISSVVSIRRDRSRRACAARTAGRRAGLLRWSRRKHVPDPAGTCTALANGHGSGVTARSSQSRVAAHAGFGCRRSSHVLPGPPGRSGAGVSSAAASRRRRPSGKPCMHLHAALITALTPCLPHLRILVGAPADATASTPRRPPANPTSNACSARRRKRSSRSRVPAGLWLARCTAMSATPHGGLCRVSRISTSPAKSATGSGAARLLIGMLAMASCWRWRCAGSSTSVLTPLALQEKGAADGAPLFSTPPGFNRCVRCLGERAFRPINTHELAWRAACRWPWRGQVQRAKNRRRDGMSSGAHARPRCATGLRCGACLRPQQVGDAAEGQPQ